MIDAFHLARVQFGFTVAFHITFPAFSIGLASYLMVLEALWLHPTILGMLFGLIFRDVAFELCFRAQTPLGRRLWDLYLLRRLHHGGSLPGADAGWAAAGDPRGGRPVCRRLVRLADAVHRAVRGGPGGGYAWLGACWLVWRTEGSLQNLARRQAAVLGWVMLGLIVAVSLWTPFLNPTFEKRWFHWPGILLTSPLPLLVAVLAVLFHWALARRHHLTPFLCALAIFVLCFAGLGISFSPLIVPPDITIWQAAAPRASQVFVVVGASVLIPLILTYSGFSYWVFRGKVQAGDHYD